jgi:hypothetical protein
MIPLTIRTPMPGAALSGLLAPTFNNFVIVLSDIALKDDTWQFVVNPPNGMNVFVAISLHKLGPARMVPRSRYDHL